MKRQRHILLYLGSAGDTRGKAYTRGVSGFDKGRVENQSMQLGRVVSTQLAPLRLESGIAKARYFLFIYKKKPV